ncbi:MAG: TetR family transcriptional regulator [Porticoccaceae bacterium]|nr:TetR family transcriptional regulator [Porticoccaceae bacterium]
MTIPSDNGAAASRSTDSQSGDKSRTNPRRQRIIRAAADLFLDRGFVNTSVDQIADQAQVSKQTVYSHFGSKEKLFIAAVESRCVATGLFPTFNRAGADPRRALYAMARDFAGMLLERDSARLLRLCYAGAETHPEVSALFFESGPARLSQVLEDYLRGLAEAGLVTLDNPRFAALQFLYMVNGEPMFRVNLGLERGWTDRELEDYLNSCVDFFLRGCSYRGGAG